MLAFRPTREGRDRRPALGRKFGAAMSGVGPGAEMPATGPQTPLAAGMASPATDVAAVCPAVPRPACCGVVCFIGLASLVGE